MWMSDAFAEMMLGHLVCLVQGNAFILVEWAYLGIHYKLRIRRFHPLLYM